MSDAQRGFIAPTVDADSSLWWEGLKRGVLVLHRCSECGRDRCPPLPACPYCGSPRKPVVAASGLGRIYSWTTVRRSLSPQFAGDEPYTILTVQLDEGPRIFGRLLSGQPQAEAKVKAAFYEVEETTLVGFEMQTADSAEP